MGIAANGEVVQTGMVKDLEVAPQQTKSIKLNYSTEGICKCKELLLNVAFKLKKAETLLPAGYTVAQKPVDDPPVQCSETGFAECTPSEH